MVHAGPHRRNGGHGGACRDLEHACANEHVWVRPRALRSAPSPGQVHGGHDADALDMLPAELSARLCVHQEEHGHSGEAKSAKQTARGRAKDSGPSTPRT